MPTLDPASYSSLYNTLSPAGLLTLMEAEQRRQAEALASQTAAAAQTAQGAGQAYAAAAAAPPPELGAVEQFLPTLFSNMASVISGEPSYRENTQQTLRDKRRTLLQARTENLQALRDNHLQAAQRAKELGDFEAEQKARMSFEKISKTLDVMQMNATDERQKKGFEHDIEMEGKRSASEISNIQERGRQERLTNEAKFGSAGTAGNPEVAHWVSLLDTGQAQLSQVPMGPQGRFRDAVARELYASGSKILTPKVRATLDGLSGAEGVLGTVRDLVTQVNTTTEGGPLGVRRQLGGLASQARGLSQSTVSDAVYDTEIEGFLAKFSRMTGEVGVLTEQDVGRARRLLPRRNDTAAVAKYKVDMLEHFVRGQKARTLRNFTASSKELASPWGSSTWFAREDGKVYAKAKDGGSEGWVDPNDPDIDLVIPALPPPPGAKKKGR